jgi:hypothetical protein
MLGSSAVSTIYLPYLHSHLSKLLESVMCVLLLYTLPIKEPESVSTEYHGIALWPCLATQCSLSFVIIVLLTCSIFLGTAFRSLDLKSGPRTSLFEIPPWAHVFPLKAESAAAFQSAVRDHGLGIIQSAIGGFINKLSW